MPKSHRSALAKFRCGVAPLNIELGRYNGTPLDERLCLACVQSVETEQHVLVECDHYDSERLDLFDKSRTLVSDFDTLCALDKFVVVMSHPELQRISARTCFDILSVHRRFIRA